MPDRKPRILLVSEASFLSSGYATYGMEVQKRLHATGKYEMAELACYGTPDDHRRYEMPWGYFGNVPPPGHDDERAEYDRREAYQFGEWRFNDVVLDYRPDIVWDFRDPWMWAYQGVSPHRRHYHHCLMPTVDAVPQQDQWLASYIGADAVLTYTDWAQDVLRSEGGGLIKLRGVASPGADLETFRPMHKADMRRSFGFEDGVNVVGTIMRNSPRKLYPQLVRDFATFLAQADPDTAIKTYLYLHTSYPDNGWDIPKLIKKSGISHKILVTYWCRACESVFPSVFRDARAACSKCGDPAATMPNVERAVSRRSLAMIINLFDVYVQYSAAEGLGMPQVEAAACGVPVMAVDYSAMSDVVRKVGGYPIALASLEVEPSSERLMARPDGSDLVKKLLHFFAMGPSLRAEKSFRARKGAESFTWEKAAAAWMGVFDSLPLRPEGETWASPPRIHRPRPAPPEFPSQEAFVEWSIDHVLGRPEMKGQYMALRMIRDLNWGWTHQTEMASYHSEESLLGQRRRTRPFGTNEALAELTKMCEYYNEWEVKRCRISSHSSSPN